MVHNIVEINSRKKVFTLDEARKILPLVHRITREARQKVQACIQTLNGLPDKNCDKGRKLEAEINEAVGHWQAKLEKLGVEPKGLWVADFNSGSGYFCWRFPEEAIEFWHNYSDGFSKRTLIAQTIKHLHNANVKASVIDQNT